MSEKAAAAPPGERHLPSASRRTSTKKRRKVDAVFSADTGAFVATTLLTLGRLGA